MAGAGFAGGVVVALLAAPAAPLLAFLVAGMLVAGGGALYPRIRRELVADAERRREVRARAEQQHNWASRGDMRGVYGPEGAELMRTVAPPPARPAIVPPGDSLEVAGVVATPAELTEMLRRKLPCWRYAAFASVLVQRQAAVAERVRDARMGFATPSGDALHTGSQAAVYFGERLAELCRLVEAVDDFMLSTAFQAVFGDREESADADGIVHAANRLMDFHERLLVVTERCRGVTVPWSVAELQRDVGLFTVIPIEGFNTFVDTFVDRVAEMADVARYATGDVQLDPVELHAKADDELMARIFSRLEQVMREG